MLWMITHVHTIGKKSQLPTMFIQRMRFVMIEVYKVLNNIGPVYLRGMFTYKENNYDMRSSNILTQPAFKNVKYGFNTIKYKGAKIWNCLPNEIKEAQSLTYFKSLINKWYGGCCSCQTVKHVNHIWYDVLESRIYMLQ